MLCDAAAVAGGVDVARTPLNNSGLSALDTEDMRTSVVASGMVVGHRVDCLGHGSGMMQLKLGSWTAEYGTQVAGRELGACGQLPSSLVFLPMNGQLAFDPVSFNGTQAQLADALSPEEEYCPDTGVP